MHLGESATLLRQRENESDKCTRDIISMKREQPALSRLVQIHRRKYKFRDRDLQIGVVQVVQVVQVESLSTVKQR